MVTAIINRYRIQSVNLMWYRCTFLKGLGWVGAALLGLIAIVAYAGVFENSLYFYLGFGYLTGGMCWLIAARISAATIITDFAVIRDTNKKGGVLGWNQVTDFFVHEKEGASQYVFLYKTMDGKHERFELSVPHAYQALFKKVVHRCVESKALPAPERAYG